MSDSPVDSYRWLPRSMAAYYQALEVPQADPIPFTPLEKPLGATRFVAITTGGVHLRSDQPFDLTRERQEPTWGDPTFRVLPADVSTEDVAISHLHYNHDDALDDLDVVFPVPLLRTLADAGTIGDITPRHYSFMGFQLDPTELLEKHLPRVIEHLREDAAEAVILTPA